LFRQADFRVTSGQEIRASIHASHRPS
jgi:hypothetical protein